jgi:hypothetical protein
VPSTHLIGVRLPGTALKRRKHYGDAAGPYPAERGSIPWRRTGVYANRQSGRPQKAEVASSSLAAPTQCPFVQRQDSGLWSRESWFESMRGSLAAAHGCGFAFVRRMARFDPGWRLFVLVAQWQEAPE